MNKQQKQMSAADIYNRLATGIDLECPSGVTVRVKPFSLHDFLKHGVVPDELSQTVKTVVAQGIDALLKADDAAGFVDWMSLVVCEALVTPSAVMERDSARDAQSVCVWDIPAGDRLAIYNTAMGDYRTEVKKWLPLSATGAGDCSSTSMLSPHATDSAPAESSA